MRHEYRGSPSLILTRAERFHVFGSPHRRHHRLRSQRAAGADAEIESLM